MSALKASLLSLILVAGAALPEAGAGPRAGGASAGGGLRVRVADIMDPTGFERPMRASSTVIPENWKTEGGVFYIPGNPCATGPRFNWKATAPDGRQSLEILPGFTWSAANNMPPAQGCLNQAFTRLEDVAQFLVGSLQNGRIAGIERDPSGQALFAAYSNEMQGDPYMKSWANGAEIRFTYTENGKAREGIAVIMTYHTYMKSGWSFGYGYPVTEAVNGSLLLSFFYTAEKGAFDEAVYRLALMNYRQDPEWDRRIAQINAQISRDNMAAARERSRIMAETNDYVRNLSQKTFEDRMASGDYTQRERGEALRGVETYDADVPGGQVELPGYYDRAFQLSDGTFVLTDDQYFDPYRDTGLDGRELTPTK